MSTVEQPASTPDQQQAKIEQEIDAVLSNESNLENNNISDFSQNEHLKNVISKNNNKNEDDFVQEVSAKAGTRAALIQRCKQLAETTQKFPVVNNNEIRNFSRAKKKDLEKCLAWYLNSFAQEETQGGLQNSQADSFQQEFVSETLLRANYVLLQALESFSGSPFVQKFTGGLRIEGTAEKLDTDVCLREAMKMSLWEIYLENEEVLAPLMKGTTKLLFLNLQIIMSCATRQPARPRHGQIPQVRPPTPPRRHVPPNSFWK